MGKPSRRPHRRLRHGDKAVEAAVAKHLKGDITGALFDYAKLGQEQPNNPKVAFFASLGAYQSKNYELAERLMQRCVTLRPGHADAWYNLGKYAVDQGRDEEALNLFMHAASLKPNFAEAWNNAGNLWAAQGDYEQAEACYQKSLACKTDNPDSLYNRSFLKLMRGDLAGGFLDYEARYNSPAFRIEYTRPFMATTPPWDGKPLAGRKLLVMHEQGFGDTIMFSRYVWPLYRALGGFTLEVQAPLVDLMRVNMPEDVTVIARTEDHSEMDCWVSLMSLPAIYGGLVDTPTPYLVPDTIERPEIPEGVRRVGLCWAGSTGHKNDHNRSIPFDALRVLGEVPDIQWLSLQVGPREPEAVDAPWLERNAGKWATFLSSAREIAGLDLVITVDTAIAHLAGALGVPTWVMLPPVPDFRWQLFRPDSPWYPSARLYRADKSRQWDDVVARIFLDLDPT